MPVLTNSIDAFTFDDLVGSLPLREEELEIFKRNGIAGIGARKLAQRAKQATLKTVRYVVDFQDAETTLTNYKTLVGQDPKTIIRNSIDYGTFLIVSVKETKVEAVVSAIGSIVTNPQARLECEWTIIG